MAVLRPFLVIFPQLHIYLLQNLGSDVYFEVLNGSKSYLVQNLCNKTQLFPFFCNFVKNTSFVQCFLLFYNRKKWLFISVANFGDQSLPCMQKKVFFCSNDKKCIYYRHYKICCPLALACNL